MAKSIGIAALRLNSLTRCYDALITRFLREREWRSALIEQARLRPGLRVLDVGSGTGTLALQIKSMRPDVEIVGLDGNPASVEIARGKAAVSGMAVTFDIGVSYSLPYVSQSFNRVVSSLVLRHLTTADKARTVREMYRVLKRGGELHVADWGKPKTLVMEMCFSSVYTHDVEAVTDAKVEGWLPSIIEQAGFKRVLETQRYATLMGPLALFEAFKPA